MTLDVAIVDVCVCTLRRELLRETLLSLAAQVLPAELAFRVIVADNDVEERARELAEDVAKSAGLNLTYLHCPALNISVARNACLDAASAEWLAFLDDDEMATPGWLAQFVAAAHRTRADVILGPVRAVYPPGSPGWMRKGDFHSTRPVMVRGRIITGYCGNVLIRRSSPAVVGQRFRPDLGLTGGEDTEYFHRVFLAGGSIAFAPQALVNEPVAPDRARLAWLTRRSYRAGKTHAELLLSRELTPLTRVRQRGTTLAKMFVSFAAALASGPGSVRSWSWFLRGMLHAGAFARLSRRKAVPPPADTLEKQEGD